MQETGSFYLETGISSAQWQTMKQRDKDAMAMVGDRPAKLPAHADSRACVLPWYGLATRLVFILVVAICSCENPYKNRPEDQTIAVDLPSLIAEIFYLTL